MTIESDNPWRPLSTAPLKELIDLWAPSDSDPRDPNGIRITDCYYDGFEFRRFKLPLEQRLIKRATHWMRQPPPPERL